MFAILFIKLPGFKNQQAAGPMTCHHVILSVLDNFVVNCGDCVVYKL